MPLKGSVDLKKLRKKVNGDLRSVYLAGLKPIITETPAVSGVTRNSWFLTTGKPFNLESTRGGDKGGSSSIASLESNMPKTVLGKKIFLTNNSPAIVPLEYGGYPNPPIRGSYDKVTRKYVKLSSGGYSLQAPGGWVRKYLKKMARKVNSL
jgi:hypothetical protein